MRLCVVSDTHRHRHELLTVVKSLQPLDAILHAGDESSDADWLAQRVDWPIYAVAGNWDPVSDDYPVSRVLDVGLKVWMTHGHKFRVKEGLGSLQQQAEVLEANIVIFGHTHHAMAALWNGRLFVNPGSLASPRGRRERTCAVLEIERDVGALRYQVRASLMTIQGEITHTVIHTTLP